MKKQKTNVSVSTVNELLEQARFRESFKMLPHGDTFKDLSTVIIIPIRGNREEKETIYCDNCKTKHEVTKTVINGLSPIFVEAYKRLIKPMNVPVVEMMVPGYEVGDAYNTAIEMILNSPGLKDFKYVLTIEDDNIVPFIPNSQGPLMMLYECMEKGFDIAGGLYWTKGIPSMPLLYGFPEDKKDSVSGMFSVRYDWKDKPEGPIECNGLGMGFTLFKMDLFKDKRLEKPWFKTVNENNEQGQKMYTQDLYFFEKARELGYRVCVDTRVKVGHLDVKSGIIY